MNAAFAPLAHLLCCSQQVHCQIGCFCPVLVSALASDSCTQMLVLLRNTWAHILSRSEELPQTLFSSLFLSTFLQLKHWLRRQHEEIKFLSAQESHTSGPVTGRPPWSYLSFPASQSGKRREGWSSLRCFISMSYFLSRWFWQLPTNRKSLITSIQWCYSHITSLWLELGTAFLNLGIIDSWGWMSLCCGVCPVCYRTAAAPLTSTLWRPIAPTPS